MERSVLLGSLPHLNIVRFYSAKQQVKYFGREINKLYLQNGDMCPIMHSKSANGLWQRSNWAGTSSAVP